MNRNIVGFLLGLVGAYLFVLGTGGVELPGLNVNRSGAGQALSLFVGLALAVSVAVWMSRGYNPERDDISIVRNPTFVQFLFESPRSAPLWLGIRIFFGLELVTFRVRKTYQLGMDKWIVTSSVLVPRCGYP